VALVVRDTTSITVTGAKQDVTVAGSGLVQLIVR
jgi:hypothetical protein